MYLDGMSNVEIIWNGLSFSQMYNWAHSVNYLWFMHNVLCKILWRKYRNLWWFIFIVLFICLNIVVARDHICMCCNMNDKLMLKWSKQLNKRLMATQLCVLLLCNWIAHTKTILPIVMCVWLWFVLFILMAHWVRLTNHNIQIDANSMKWSMNCFSAHKLHFASTIWPNHQHSHIYWFNWYSLRI